MNDILETRSNTLSTKTINCADEIISRLDNYSSRFTLSDKLSFSISQSQLEKHFEEYLLFAASLFDTVREMSATNAELALLLIEADKAMEIELTLSLEARFNAFTEFESALYEYTSSVEGAYDNGSLSISILLNSAQKFKNALLALKQANTKY